MELAERLTALVAVLSRTRERVLVGIDGPDTAGKTMLAGRLADRLADRPDGAPPVPVIRASIDGFHRPRDERLRRGPLSPEGYYRDSFDYPALRDECLAPFLDGAATVRLSQYDYRSESGRDRQATDVPARAVLVFDGAFLLRKELRDLWTLSAYLRVSPEEALRRAVVRDRDLFGSAQEVERRYRARYRPGQALYRQEADPEAAADVLVDNERVAAPRIERWPDS